LIFEGSCPLVPELLQAENHDGYSIPSSVATVTKESLAWQAGTPGKPWQNFLFPRPTGFIKPSKIKPAPPTIMEMLLKKEVGTAKASAILKKRGDEP